MNQANVTINKTQKITYGLTNGEIDLSEGYIAKLQKRASNNLDEFMKEMKEEIIKQPLLHWDDTVLNVLSKDTIVEHDHNKINYNKSYKFKNAEYNRHLISDLKKVIDNLNHTWAKKMIELLTKTNKKKERRISKGETEFPQEELNKFEEKFEKIMLETTEENENETQKYYASEEKTLIVRIFDYKNEYFLWVYDFDIPFTNNLSKRSLRGAKSKQKASGQFWNINSAKWYANIRTYIETCNRNNVNIYNALLKLSLEKPYTLKEILSGEI